MHRHGVERCTKRRDRERSSKELGAEENLGKNLGKGARYKERCGQWKTVKTKKVANGRKIG